MSKDNQGGRQRAGKSHKAEPVAFTQGMERIAGWTAATVDSRLLPISRALSDTTHKARLAERAGSQAELERLWTLLSQQRLQIMLAEPENALDVMVMASTAMWLADLLPAIEGPEGIQQAAHELVYALGAIRRFHETCTGISSDTFGLNGRPLEQ
jgi:hypothetical protein